MNHQNRRHFETMDPAADFMACSFECSRDSENGIEPNFKAEKGLLQSVSIHKKNQPWGWREPVHYATHVLSLITIMILAGYNSQISRFPHNEVVIGRESWCKITPHIVQTAETH
jgi:hypothetical protein